MGCGRCRLGLQDSCDGNLPIDHMRIAIAIQVAKELHSINQKLDSLRDDGIHEVIRLP
jgi:hypothetical protein